MVGEPSQPYRIIARFRSGAKPWTLGPHARTRDRYESCTDTRKLFECLSLSVANKLQDLGPDRAPATGNDGTSQETVQRSQQTGRPDVFITACRPSTQGG